MRNNLKVTIVTFLSLSSSSLLILSLYRYFKQQSLERSSEVPLGSSVDKKPSSDNEATDLDQETDSGPVIPNVTKYGKPSILTEIKKPGYYILYNTLTKTPLYVIEKLTKDGISKAVSNGNESTVTVDREGMNFYPEHDLKTTVRSTNADFHGSGFDRGHMAAAGNHVYNADAMMETFTLGNVVPQFPACNRGNWKTLENHVRSVAKQDGVTTVYVYSGSLFIPQTPEGSAEAYVIYKVIGDRYVAVPTHFFKVMVVECGKRVSVSCFMVENAPDCVSKTPDDMRVGLSDVECWSGISFEKLRKYS